MDRFELMRVFVRIVETGSLSAAARDLRTTQPTVSKQLSALESAAGVRLLQRNTQGIRLTDAGQRYLESARRIVAEVESLDSEVAGLDRVLKGRMRLSVPVGLGEVQLTRIALRFVKQHPDLHLELSLSDRVVDLVEDGVDVAVRIGRVSDPNVVARPLGTLGMQLVATPAYLREHGTPRRPEDLSRHNYLRYGTEDVEALDTPTGPVSVPIHSNVSVNNSQAVREAILSGMGVGRAALWLLDDDVRAKRLKVVLPGVAPTPSAFYAVYLPASRQPEKVRAFVAFLREAVREIPGWAPAQPG